MKFLYTFLFSILFLTSCQVKLKDINPPTAAAKLTVDGTVSDSVGNHYVRLTKTVDILSTETTPGINDALVVITDNTGFQDTFKLAPRGDGYYVPSKSWAGAPGNTYTLKVVTTDQTVSASETMPNWPDFKIEKLVPFFRETATKNRVSNHQYNDNFLQDSPYIKVDDSVYRVRIYGMAQLPYRVNVQTYIYRNSSPYYVTGFYINNLNQIPIDSNFIYPPGGGGQPINVHFLLGDNVTVVLKGLTNECYEYYRGLNAVLNSDGGLFNSPPGNPVNNMDNKEVLGYFKTVVSTSKTITISTANRKF